MSEFIRFSNRVRMTIAENIRRGEVLTECSSVQLCTDLCMTTENAPVTTNELINNVTIVKTRTSGRTKLSVLRADPADLLWHLLLATVRVPVDSGSVPPTWLVSRRRVPLLSGAAPPLQMSTNVAPLGLLDRPPVRLPVAVGLTVTTTVFVRSVLAAKTLSMAIPRVLLGQMTPAPLLIPRFDRLVVKERRVTLLLPPGYALAANPVDCYGDDPFTFTVSAGDFTAAIVLLRPLSSIMLDSTRMMCVEEILLIPVTAFVRLMLILPQSPADFTDTVDELPPPLRELCMHMLRLVPADTTREIRPPSTLWK